jgi:ElaB/YqjD/DUF883 family membrane-anchored ribosome-binding protein
MKLDLTEQLSEDLSALARDAEELLRGTDGDGAVDRAREIRERLAAALDRADETIHRLAEPPASSAIAGVEDFVRRRPLQALGLAAGAGLLLGLLLKRK